MTLSLRPSLPAQNPADSIGANAVLSRDFALKATAVSNVDYLGARYLGVPVTFAMDVAPLGEHVLRIVPVGAKEKVLDVNAGAVIASVAYQHPAGDWTISDLPRKPMNVAGCTVPTDTTISILGFVRCPYPAPIGYFGGMVGESLFEGPRLGDAGFRIHARLYKNPSEVGMV